MKPGIWLFSAAVAFSSIALAQTAPKSQVTETTDPAKIAEVERHAQELAAEEQKSQEQMQQKKSKSSEKQKSKAKHKGAKKEKAPSETPMPAPENKG